MIYISIGRRFYSSLTVSFRLSLKKKRPNVSCCLMQLGCDSKWESVCLWCGLVAGRVLSTSKGFGLMV